MAEAKAIELKAAGGENNQQPHRTKLAMEILTHLNYIETTLNSDFMKKDGRDLTKEEIALKSATINCLRQYISGEINLGDCSYSGVCHTEERVYTESQIIQKLKDI